MKSPDTNLFPLSNDQDEVELQLKAGSKSLADIVQTVSIICNNYLDSFITDLI